MQNTSSTQRPPSHLFYQSRLRRPLVDRAEGSIPVLIDLIAKESGLANREVVRRAQRKRRALGPVTLWMALALVAREQGLDMERVAAAIERAAS